jgi:hypothetical protein
MKRGMTAAIGPVKKYHAQIETRHRAAWQAAKCVKRNTAWIHADFTDDWDRPPKTDEKGQPPK